MAEPMRWQAVSAFAGLLARAASLGPAIDVRERSGLGIAAVTVRKGQDAAFGEFLRTAHGIGLRPGPKVFAGAGLALIGTGPGSHLAIRDAAGPALATELAQGLHGIASVCDQSAAYGVLRLSGPKVRDVLAKGVPIDLHPSAFRPGDAAVTLAGHVSIVLWQPDAADSFDLAVSRSYAGSFMHWLDESAEEFAVRAG